MVELVSKSQIFILPSQEATCELQRRKHILKGQKACRVYVPRHCTGLQLSPHTLIPAFEELKNSDSVSLTHNDLTADVESSTRHE